MFPLVEKLSQSVEKSLYASFGHCVCLIMEKSLLSRSSLNFVMLISEKDLFLNFSLVEQGGVFKIM